MFDLNFDKREFSAVHTIEGWKTWAMQDVSTAAYRATQKAACFRGCDAAETAGVSERQRDHLGRTSLCTEFFFR